MKMVDYTSTVLEFSAITWKRTKFDKNTQQLVLFFIYLFMVVYDGWFVIMVH